jgi:3-oxoacyl-[acyl-carrier protein] reductase
MILKDHVAIVTGGSRGIGKACSLMLASEGASIVIASRDEADGMKTAKEIETKGAKALYVKTDISRIPDVETLVEKTVNQFKRIDILVNNAGNASMPSIVCDMPYEDWHSVINVNLNGTFYCLRNAAKVMKDHGYGRIINISSMGASFGYTMMANYTVSKIGVLGLTYNAAKELGKFGITVNAIQPGVIRTDLSVGFARYEKELAAKSPIPRMGEPDDVARLVLFLASPTTSFITGTVIKVDGGYPLRVAPEDIAEALMKGL